MLGPFEPVQLGTLLPGATVAKIGRHKPLDGVVITNDGELSAIVKILEPRKLLTELCCTTLARGVGLPVPPPILVKVSSQHYPNLDFRQDVLAFGSVRTNYPNYGSYFNSKDSAERALKKWPKLVDCAAFDLWLGIEDRIPNNLLFDGSNKFCLIDFDDAVAPHLAPETVTRGELSRCASQGLSEIELHRLRQKMSITIANAPDIDLLYHAIPTGSFTEGSKILAQLLKFLQDRVPHMHRIITTNLGIKQLDLIDNEADTTTSHKR